MALNVFNYYCHLFFDLFVFFQSIMMLNIDLVNSLYGLLNILQYLAHKLFFLFNLLHSNFVLFLNCIFLFS